MDKIYIVFSDILYPMCSEPNDLLAFKNKDEAQSAFNDIRGRIKKDAEENDYVFEEDEGYACAYEYGAYRDTHWYVAMREIPVK